MPDEDVDEPPEFPLKPDRSLSFRVSVPLELSTFELPFFELLLLEVFVTLFEEGFELLLVPVTMPLYLSSMHFEVFEDEVVIGNFVVVTDLEALEMLFVFGALGVVVVRGVNDFDVKGFVIVVVIGTFVVTDVVVVDDVVVARTGFEVEISPVFLSPGDFGPMNFVVVLVVDVTNFVAVFVVDVLVGFVVVGADVVVVADDVVVISTVVATISLPTFLPPVGFEVLPESFPFLGRETGETIRFILDL